MAKARPSSDVQPGLFDEPAVQDARAVFTQVVVGGCLPNILNKAEDTLSSVDRTAPTRDSARLQERLDLVVQIKRDTETLAHPIDPLSEWWTEFYTDRIATCRARCMELVNGDV